jgi:AraC family transcriptional regulator of adaptative response/methylated-DNA-[protein]-cysteine methyltransferase
MDREVIAQLEQNRWRAVENRDRFADAAFYYAVVTTGIYCLPECSSRLPRRENVVFFETITEAEQAGYRACQKCMPGGRSRADSQRQKMIRACRILEQSAHPVKLEALAAEAEMSLHHFQRRFKKIIGVTPKQYELQYRAYRFRDELKSAKSVTEAVYAAGYGSGGTVYEKNQDHLAMQPKVFKKGGEGERIIYGTVPCFLGWLMVAATRRGICAIEFGDDPELLVARLKERFHKAEFSSGDSSFQTLMQTVAEYVTEPGKEFDLPLDIRGTVFQHKVWQVLRQIQPGETRSYSAIAKQLGIPAAVRAVAGACASNPLAVVIPCHRVLKKDGSISGYRWGVERKKLLLKNEGTPQQ